jgi:hypothetical protein
MGLKSKGFYSLKCEAFMNHFGSIYEAIEIISFKIKGLG